MTTSAESEEYQSTTELELYFTQDVNDSDVEIKVFDKDGTILSGISEDEEHELADNPIEPIMDPVTAFPMHHHIDPSTFYHLLHPDDYTYGRHTASNNMATKLCEAPHLYIQQRYSASNTWWIINTAIFIDEYLSYKFFYESSWPILVEIALVFGTIIGHHIPFVLTVITLGVSSDHIAFTIFTLMAWVLCIVLIQCCKSLRILPFRALPNVIHNDDEYGFNVKRTINMRALWYKYRDSHINSIPDGHSLNVALCAMSWYLYTNQVMLFLLIPYVITARCYFAFHYVFDCILSGGFAICIALMVWSVMPQTFMIIVDEMI